MKVVVSGPITTRSPYDENDEEDVDEAISFSARLPSRCNQDTEYISALTMRLCASEMLITPKILGVLKGNV